MRTASVAAASFALVGFLSGCGSSSTGGLAVAVGSSSAKAVMFDPCAQVTEATITSLGLLPETKKPYTAKGSTVESGCRWKDLTTMSRLAVDIGFNNTQIDKYLTNLGVTRMSDLSIGGRRVVNFVTDTAGGGCNLAIDLGAAIAVVATSSSSQTAGVPDPDSCPDAVRVATAISPLFR